MTISDKKYRFLFAAGGTGGHLYPAIAVAQQIRSIMPESQILFVGTKNKLESRVVPNLGFNFKTIWISGFSRKLNLKNLFFPLKVLVSGIQSIILNMKFKPSVAIGAGAYVAGPVLWGSSLIGSKIILLEQNSYPGITNRMLDKKADEIHISFEESAKYFRDKSKIKFSGNPIRINISLDYKEKSLRSFDLVPDKKALLVIGGSLGARSINQAVQSNLEKFNDKQIQIIWQTGSLYYEEYKKYQSDSVKVTAFIDDVSSAYSAADLVIARAGATTIAEAAYLGLPVIFIPSPNVAADHQFKNAKSIADAGAAVLLKDSDAKNNLGDLVTDLIENIDKLNLMSEKIKMFSKPNAAKEIAESAVRLAQLY